MTAGLTLKKISTAQQFRTKIIIHTTTADGSAETSKIQIKNVKISEQLLFDCIICLL